MSILDQVCHCQCKMCVEKTTQELQESRELWDKGQRDILFQTEEFSCEDGLCYDNFTNVIINGFKVSCDGDNAESVVRALLDFLGILDVSVKWEHK